MFGLGVTELVIILVIVLLLFGAGKVPSIMRDLGEGLKTFKDTAKDGDKDDAKSQAESAKKE